MNDEGHEFVEAMHREAVARLGGKPLTSPEQSTIPCTELPEAASTSPLYREWNTYRREVTRLLAEGHEGQFVLIKGETILGIYDTWDAARGEGLQRYLLNPFLVHQIQSREPLLRLRGYSLPCPS